MILIGVDGAHLLASGNSSSLIRIQFSPIGFISYNFKRMRWGLFLSPLSVHLYHPWKTFLENYLNLGNKFSFLSHQHYFPFFSGTLNVRRFFCVLPININFSSVIWTAFARTPLPLQYKRTVYIKSLHNEAKISDFSQINLFPSDKIQTFFKFFHQQQHSCRSSFLRRYLCYGSVRLWWCGPLHSECEITPRWGFKGGCEVDSQTFSELIHFHISCSDFPSCSNHTVGRGECDVLVLSPDQMDWEERKWRKKKASRWNWKWRKHRKWCLHSIFNNFHVYFLLIWIAGNYPIFHFSIPTNVFQVFSPSFYFSHSATIRRFLKLQFTKIPFFSEVFP